MRSRPTPPATTDDLLVLLRATRLLDDEQVARLGAGWDDGPPGPRLDQLVQAGLLTPYQAEQVRAGRPRRLRLGPYRLLERLGEGRPVFKAEHVLLRRLVVLKVLGRARRRGVAVSSLPTPNDPLPTPRSTPRRSGQPRREVETTGSLDHPHIVAAHHAARLRGRLVLVLEHIDGVDLHRLVRETGPLPVALACEVARQAALALSYLHARGLVHRDVKPANLVLGGDRPERPVVKLLDLGLACPAGHDDELCGTMDYIAPERGMGGEGNTARADLYGLGCTLYYLLTGRVPFPGGSWTAKLLNHRLDEPEPIRDVRPEVPERVVGMVARLMARDPHGRPGSAAEVVGTLEALARPAPQPPAAAARPRRAGVLYGLSAALVLGALSGGSARWAGQRESARTDRPPLASEAPSAALSPRPAWRLDEALAAASDGATVVVPAGTHVVEPARVRGKRLTLRAAPGPRPVLQRRPGAASWDALLDTDRDLELIGLELRGGREAMPAPLVSVEGAALVVRGCRLEQAGAAPLVSARRGPRVTVANCELLAGRQAVAVEAAGRQAVEVRVEGGSVTVGDPGGVALLVWAAEVTAPAAVSVSLDGTTVRGGRVLACRAVAGPVNVRARGNRLAFREALVSLDGYGDREAWRRVLHWSGQGNRFEAGGAWLRLEGTQQPLPPRPLP